MSTSAPTADRALSQSSSAARNVDQHELDKFQTLASRWWDPNSEFKPLHEINPLRLSWIREQAGGSLAGLDALDVGCGGGILTESLAADGAKAMGIDLAEKSLKIAKLHALDTGVPVTYEQIAVEELAARQPEHFDVVTCMEMLEHVPDFESVIHACAKLAKPGGLLTFSTLNRNPKSFLFAIVGAEYLLKLLPKGTHSYDKMIQPAELVRAGRRAGLDPTGFIGLSYNPFTKQYHLQPNDVSVNYMVAFRKPA
ncbi:MAG: bifunctional 2-polyprenyl-6-hydroxyphenol methylase/3-demethylubiquinol 3-O-methyltransferase UbiG [Lautropia sp.]|nr:bifunctional 2-polyprenyl-6-hydroxyphenol methylase/3-demethylubiquinol 3-O-methyltransferase UbiG [Lautropia sp.]